MVAGHAPVGTDDGDRPVMTQALALQSCGQRLPKGGTDPRTFFLCLGSTLLANGRKRGKGRVGRRRRLQREVYISLSYEYA